MATASSPLPKIVWALGTDTTDVYLPYSSVRNNETIQNFVIEFMDASNTGLQYQVTMNGPSFANLRGALSGLFTGVASVQISFQPTMIKGPGVYPVSITVACVNCPSPLRATFVLNINIYASITPLGPAELPPVNTGSSVELVTTYTTPSWVLPTIIGLVLVFLVILLLRAWFESRVARMMGRRSVPPPNTPEWNTGPLPFASAQLPSSPFGSQGSLQYGMTPQMGVYESYGSIPSSIVSRE
jgi:hypothetical protein